MQRCVMQWDGCKVITVCLAFDLRCQSQKPQRERQRVGLLVPNSRQQLLRSFSLPHHLPCPFYALVTLSLVHCHKNNKNVIIIRTRGDQRLLHTGRFVQNVFQTDLNIRFGTWKYLQFARKTLNLAKRFQLAELSVFYVHPRHHQGCNLLWIETNFGKKSQCVLLLQEKSGKLQAWGVAGNQRIFNLS